MLTIEKLRRMRDVASLKEEADLLIKNLKIINTITQEIHEVNLSIVEDRIVGFSGEKAKVVIDAKGMYASPLLIDAHMHIESTLLTPGVLNDLLLPRGVGTIIADPHEIANVSGKQGIEYILKSVEALDLDFKVALPSCVPSTSFEHSGAILKAEDLFEFYDHPNVIGLAEVMDYFSVLDDEDMLNKLFDAQTLNKTIDGHGAILDEVGLDVFAAMNILNDHECGDLKGMQDRLRRGIYTFIREGTVCKNLEDLIKAVDLHNYRYVCLCTDDKHPDDLAKDGGIDGVLRKAIELNVDPIMAISLATLNPSKCYKLDDIGVLTPGKKADFFLFEDLNNIQAKKVFKNGVLVAEDGKVINEKKHLRVEVSESILHSINYKPFCKSDIQIDLGKSNGMNMIEVSAGSVVTKLLKEVVDKNEDNQFVQSIEKDHAKLIVVERHHATGNIGLSCVKGFGLLKGAIATTVAHDSHNIIAVGMNDGDMMLAVDQVQRNGGGYVLVVDGQVKSCVKLEVSGLMTNSSLEQTTASLHKLHSDVNEIIVDHKFNPFLMLSFISLPVIPEVKLTDIGLIEVTTGSVMELPVMIDKIDEIQEEY